MPASRGGAFPPLRSGLDLRAMFEPELQRRRLDSPRPPSGPHQPRRKRSKFTAEGSVTVRVVSQPADTVRVEVEDTGVGIAPIDLDRTPALRAGPRTTGKGYGGTGLGLAICVEVVKGMGGTIGGFESAVGAGSLFWIEVSLPTAPLPETPRLGWWFHTRSDPPLGGRIAQR